MLPVVLMAGRAASGAPASTTVAISQSIFAGQTGQNDVLTAVVSTGGGPAPEGTPVEFHPMGGLTADHLYTTMAAKPDGTGYWLIAADGAVRNFGSAPALAGTSTDGVNDPVQDAVPTPDGRGFWMVNASGTVTARGYAGFYGDLSGVSLLANQYITGMATTPDGKGYRLLTNEGAVDCFGDAGFYGSTAGRRLSGPAVDLVATADGRGYWIVTDDGDVYPFGDGKETEQVSTLRGPLLSSRRSDISRRRSRPAGSPTCH